MKFKDQLNRSLSLEKSPKRIICLVPSLTELLVDLGLRKNIMGITKFCVHPKELRKEKTVVGGTKTLDFNKIYELNPDIILCNKEENTPEIVEKCGDIAPVHVSDIRTLSDTYELIEQYGAVFSVEKNAVNLVRNLKSAAASFRNSLKQNQKLKTAYLIWRKPWMTAGKDTFIDYLLELNGLENYFKQHPERYPEIELKVLESVDLVMLSSEPFPFKEKHITELRAYTKATILLVDGEFFSWYGSRLLKAFDYFKRFQKQLKA